MKFDLDQLFADFSKMKVAVIGDVMLDTYWWGSVDRISPEAPVPIMSVNKKEQRIGGAGNVALNVVQLGASVAVLSVLGNDEDGVELKKLLQDNQIDTRFLLKSKNRITTNKIRIISRNQHMMRLDAEHTTDLVPEDEENLMNQIEKYILTEKPDVVILEDYNKGILTHQIITKTIDLCNKNSIVTTVDPKRKNFFSYKNVSLFKPNLSEAITALNIIPEEISNELLEAIHTQLRETLNHQVSLITLSEKGIFYEDAKNKNIIPSHRRKIADVSGAGDTVIAVASLVFSKTKDTQLTAEIANISGGIVCEEVGTVSINKERLLAECKRLIS
ncbi:MAG: PfkB family carbohydrate kinase [Ginsengibacter sp.]|jgi:rfaE bifunctional protein kinase chain/domain